MHEPYEYAEFISKEDAITIAYAAIFGSGGSYRQLLELVDDYCDREYIYPTDENPAGRHIVFAACDEELHKLLEPYLHSEHVYPFQRP